MTRPVLLDLFCGAGGAAMGYHRAGFDVVGVDIRPMKRYPFQFIQADALEYLAECGRCYDAIHASPPCQAFCALKHLAKTSKHPNLIPRSRELLIASGKPYVIENVPGAPLVEPALLCGTMFGLRTDCGAELRRHRLFETNWLLMSGLQCRHYLEGRPCTVPVHGHSGGSSRRDSTAHRTIGVYGDNPRGKEIGEIPRRVISVHGGRSKRTISVTGSTPQTNVERNIVRECFPVSAARVAMGIDWMTMKELSQAIPPAYTQFIGEQLREALA